MVYSFKLTKWKKFIKLELWRHDSAFFLFSNPNCLAQTYYYKDGL